MINWHCALIFVDVDVVVDQASKILGYQQILVVFRRWCRLVVERYSEQIERVSLFFID